MEHFEQVEGDPRWVVASESVLGAMEVLEIEESLVPSIEPHSGREAFVAQGLMV